MTAVPAVRRRPVAPGPPRDVRLTLEQLAARVARLLPCRQNPEHFFLEMSEIANELRRIACRIGPARG